MECKNCGETFKGNFCPNCGQRATVEKLNAKNFIKEVSGSVFQINKGLLFTMREMFLRPGQSIFNYLEGKRKPFFKPIAYAFTLSTIYFLISRLFGGETFINAFATGWSNGATDEGIDGKGVEMLDWFVANYGYTVLLLLPIFSLASHLAFRKFRRNYLEHVVLNAYVTGHQALISVVFAILSGIIGKSDLLEIIGLTVSIGYATWVFWQFFTAASRIGILVRTFFTYMLYLVLATFFTGLVFAIGTLSSIL
ncbi:MAG: DUF3667 domain-containing protein [Cytophagales bacterium]|nr:DUF3667 domain-containing protein [Cytophagales bacterium]